MLRLKATYSVIDMYVLSVTKAADQRQGDPAAPASRYLKPGQSVEEAARQVLADNGHADAVGKRPKAASPDIKKQVLVERIVHLLAPFFHVGKAILLSFVEFFNRTRNLEEQLEKEKGTRLQLINQLSYFFEKRLPLITPECLIEAQEAFDAEISSNEDAAKANFSEAILESVFEAEQSGIEMPTHLTSTATLELSMNGADAYRKYVADALVAAGESEEFQYAPHWVLVADTFEGECVPLHNIMGIFNNAELAMNAYLDFCEEANGGQGIPEGYEWHQQDADEDSIVRSVSYVIATCASPGCDETHAIPLSLLEFPEASHLSEFQGCQSSVRSTSIYQSRERCAEVPLF